MHEIPTKQSPTYEKSKRTLSIGNTRKTMIRNSYK